MMKRQNKARKILSLTFLSVLIAVIVLMSCSCADKKKENPKEPATTVADVAEKIGEGKTSFVFQVENEGKVKEYEVYTDKTSVGEALQEVGLIEGEMGDYGLYVKKVDGIEADYNTTGTYWAFYVDGEYAVNSADKTEIEDGVVYCFKVEK